jgi:hypothetical protein
MIGILFFLGYLLIAFICWFVSMYLILKYKPITASRWEQTDELGWSAFTLLLSIIWPISLPLATIVGVVLFCGSCLCYIGRFMPWFVRKCFHGDYL